MTLIPKRNIKRIVLCVVLLLSSFLFILQSTRANVLLGESKISIIYSSLSPDRIKHHTIYRGLFGPSSEVSEVDSKQFNNHSKKLYLSPDRKFIAITTEPYENHGNVSTHITDLNGALIVSAHPGSFVSWAPDSSKALLFLSGVENEDGRRIYYLAIDGTYIDSGLPENTISADISPVDGSIAYSLTRRGTDESDIYVRNRQGQDRLLLRSNKNIFAWVRWSPTGDKIALLKSDLGLSSAYRKLLILNSDGSGSEEISGINWGYPPVWSSDGTKIIFASLQNVWEYDAIQKLNRQVTNFNKGQAKHPSYSADGKIIVFASDFSGENQIWATYNNEQIQLTKDDQDKVYPIIP